MDHLCHRSDPTETHAHHSARLTAAVAKGDVALLEQRERRTNSLYTASNPYMYAALWCVVSFNKKSFLVSDHNFSLLFVCHLIYKYLCLFNSAEEAYSIITLEHYPSSSFYIWTEVTM